MRSVIAVGLAVAVSVAVAIVVRAVPGLPFGACPSDLSGPYPDMTCAALEAPIDRSDPNSPTVTLLVAKIPARDPAKRRGVLFVNPGGPGLSASERIGKLAQPDASGAPRLPAEVLDAYDLVGMDPRGVAHSSPISCVRPEFWQGPQPDPDDAGSHAVLWQHWSELAAGCGASAGRLLTHMGTIDAARDMDLLRERMGEATLSYFGSSYGTYLGAVYGQLFPQRVDRMLLDGLVDPEPEAMGFEAGFAQDAALEARLGDWLTWTARYDATFHLGGTVERTRKALDATIADFRARPRGGVGVNELLGAVYDVMFSETGWGGLSAALSDHVVRGDDRALLDIASPRVGTDMEQAAAAATVVTCSDSAWPRERADYERRAAAAAEVSRFAWWNMWIGGAACASWPVAHGSRVPITGAGLPRIVMFNSVADPGTPYRGALAMHRAMPSSVLVTETGSGKHGVFANPQSIVNPVAQQLGAAYLLRGELPAGDVEIPGHAMPVA